MKNPLRYQLSEYDCGPATMLNAMSYLFEREQIPPEIIRNIMLYSLDCYGPDGTSGKSGTSCTAMMFLSNWLQGFGRTGRLPVSGEYLSGERVYIGDGGTVNDALRRGGVAVVRLCCEGAHYVLLTGLRGGGVCMFDPYYRTEPFAREDIIMVKDRPLEYNRIVPASCLNSAGDTLYALGRPAEREAVLLFNDLTKLTPDNTIEYFI
jgi:hypothetical protein